MNSKIDVKKCKNYIFIVQLYCRILKCSHNVLHNKKALKVNKHKLYKGFSKCSALHYEMHNELPLYPFIYKAYSLVSKCRIFPIYNIYKLAPNGALLSIWEIHSARQNQNIENHTINKHKTVRANKMNNNNKTILALDLGTTTGWAMIDSTGVISSGSISFKPNRFEGGGMVYLRFKRWLTDIKHSSQQIDAVYFEEVRRHLGTDAAHKYGGFMAHLTAWCEHHNIPYQGIPVQTIKKHITGKGNASKAYVIAAVRAKGFNPTDDNEADAIALLDYTVQMESITDNDMRGDN